MKEKKKVLADVMATNCHVIKELSHRGKQKQLWPDLTRASPALQRYLVPVVPMRVCGLCGENHLGSKRTGKINIKYKIAISLSFLSVTLISITLTPN